MNELERTLAMYGTTFDDFMKMLLKKNYSKDCMEEILKANKMVKKMIADEYPNLDDNHWVVVDFVKGDRLIELILHDFDATGKTADEMCDYAYEMIHEALVYEGLLDGYF